MEGLQIATYEETTNYILKNKLVNNILNKTNLSDSEKHELIYHIVSNYSHIKRTQKSLCSKENLPLDYVSFDIETTGFSYSDKMIQIAAVKYINKKEVDSFSTYINTDGVEISTPISYFTGITDYDIKNAPTLDEAMQNFMDFISDFPLIGHNIFSFELPRIKKWANIDLKNRVAVDTYKLASCSPLNVSDFKLETLKIHYGIKLNSHNALDDSRTTAIIFEKLRNDDFHKVINKEAVEQIFSEKTFCYTGAIKMGRKVLEEHITTRGGRIAKSMSSKVNYLIVTPQIAKNLTDGIRSRKELAYEELISKNIDIIKLTEDEFIKMISED